MTLILIRLELVWLETFFPQRYRHRFIIVQAFSGPKSFSYVVFYLINNTDIDSSLREDLKEKKELSFLTHEMNKNNSYLEKGRVNISNINPSIDHAHIIVNWCIVFQIMVSAYFLLVQVFPYVIVHVFSQLELYCLPFSYMSSCIISLSNALIGGFIFSGILSIS